MLGTIIIILVEDLFPFSKVYLQKIDFSLQIRLLISFEE